MKITTPLLVLIASLNLYCCSIESSVSDPHSETTQHSAMDSLPAKPSAPSPEATSSTYKLFDDYIAKVFIEEKLIRIENTKTGESLTNDSLIRKMDEVPECPSDGFLDIQTEENKFTINQMNCSGWNFISEVISFKYDRENHKFLLQEFSLKYIDRQAPEAPTILKSYTEIDFGKLQFVEAKLNNLYRLTQ